MPIYEYQCPSCGHAFEMMMKMSASPPACPNCQATEVKKLVSVSAFILQGGGWYKDHYGLKSGGSDAKPAAKADAPAAASDGGKAAAPAAAAPTPAATTPTKAS
jgi:putative FmdB family regulatory protein